MVRFGRRLVLVLLLVTLTGAVVLTSPAAPAGGSTGSPAGPTRLGRGGQSGGSAGVQPGQGVSRETTVGPGNPVLGEIIALTSFHNALPTEPAGQIKALMLRGGATAMAVAALIAWGLSVRRGRRTPGLDAAGAAGVGPAERDAILGDGLEGPPGSPGLPGRRVWGIRVWRPISVLGWALLLAAAWLGWSAVACLWSRAAGAGGAAGGREVISFAEKFAFLVALAGVTGAALDRALVQRAAMFWLAVSGVVAGLVVCLAATEPGHRPATWFTDDPEGSRELAGVLLPGLVLAVVKLAGRVAELAYPEGDVECRVSNVQRRVSSVEGSRRGDSASREGSRATHSALGTGQSAVPAGPIRLALYAAPAGLCGLAILFCGGGAAVSAALAATVGLLVAAVLLTRGRWRIGWACGGSLAVGIGIVVLLRSPPTVAPPHVTADDLPTIVTRAEPLFDADRMAAWSFAGQLVAEHPIIGNGPWSSRLLCDRLADAESLTDARWSNRPVGPIENFWLEQWADLGLVGVVLLAGVLVLLLASAGRAIRRCPWRRHRYLIAALAGGLAAMAVQELFASSAMRHAFGAVAAAWAGLIVAAVRWANRPDPAADGGRNRGVSRSGTSDPYELGFYRGGLMFLTGAAVVLSAVGYLVAKDWSSARDHYIAVHEDIPQAEDTQRQIAGLLWEARLWRRPQTMASLRRSVADSDRRINAALDRLDEAARWSIDLPPRLDAEWQKARAGVLQIRWRIDEDSALPLAGLSDWMSVVTTATWADAVLTAMARLRRINQVHPDGAGELAASLAEGALLIARGRYLSLLAGGDLTDLQEHRNQIMLGEMAGSARWGRQVLDDRLTANPYDLPAALLRVELAHRAELPRRLPAPAAVTDWLSAKTALTLSPALRLRLLRDGLRDMAVLPAGAEQWWMVVGPADWSGRAADLLVAIVWAQLSLPIAQPEFDAMLRAAERVLREMDGYGPSSVNWWENNADLDIRNAAQTFRLAGELAIARHRQARAADAAVPVPVAPGAATQPDDLRQADEWFAKAGRLYDQDSRFDLQRIMVRLQRGQLAWYRRDRAAAVDLVEQARDILPGVDAYHAANAAEVVAAVYAFMLADAGGQARAEQARAWLDQTRWRGLESPAAFHDALARAWQDWFSPQVQPPPRPGRPFLARPEEPLDLSPLFPASNPYWPARRDPLR